MRNSITRITRLRRPLVAIGLTLLLCESVFGQTLTEDERLNWFMTRLWFWLGFGFVLGTLAVILLRRVKYVPEKLSIDRQVRKLFFLLLVVASVIVVIAIWLDLWLIHESESFTQTALMALSETGRNLQTWLLVLLADLTFFFACVLWTRGAFSGRYALWPGPPVR